MQTILDRAQVYGTGPHWWIHDPEDVLQNNDAAHEQLLDSAVIQAQTPVWG